MKTCGMMGEVVGKAASLCVQHSCTPREVYENYLDELKSLLNQPGVARRYTVNDPIFMDGPVPPVSPGDVQRVDIDPAKLPGLVVDNRKADATGTWTPGTGLEGYVGTEYIYAAPKSNASLRFPIDVQAAGKYEVRLSYREHENRATNAPVEIRDADGKHETKVNMRQKPNLESGFVSLGTFDFTPDRRGAVVLRTEGADGLVCADAIQVLPAK
jgi:hypothetical protein